MNENAFNCAFQIAKGVDQEANVASLLVLQGYSVGVVLCFVGFGPPLYCVSK